MNLYREAFTHIRNFSPSFWVVIGATLMNQIGNMAFVFLVLYLTQHLGFRLAEASSIFAAFCASMLVIGLLGGPLVDKVGAARILMISLFANGIVLLIFPFLHSFFSIILMSLVWGLTYGLYRPASLTLVSHLSSTGIHKIAFSMYRLALNLGMSIGPAIGGYLASYSYSSIFIVNGMTNLLASFILIAGLKRSAWFNFRPASQQKLSFSFKWIKKDLSLRLFLLGMIPVAMIFFQHESTLPIFLNRDLHFPLSFYGWLFTINTLMIVFLELVLNVAMMNWPYRTNFIIGSLLNTIGFAGLAFASTEGQVILLTMTWTLGEMVIFPSASSYIAEIAPTIHRGSYMSLFGTASNLGMLLGPWGGAIVMDHFGGFGLWMACGMLGVLATVIFFYTREPNSSRSN